MSAIFGGIDPNGAAVSDDQLEIIKQVTAWWQPDHQMSYKDDDITMMQQSFHHHPHAQLEDESIFSHPSGIKIVGVARLDNRSILLKTLGYNIDRHISNIQIILELFHKNGIAILNHLVGSFAFGLWNPKDRSLYVVRDQMGTQPICYYHMNRQFYFASQKKSILALEHVDRKVHWRHLVNRMSRIAPPKNSTELAHINNVEPGHYIRYSDGDISVHKYWELDITRRTHFQSTQDYVDRFMELYERAVSDRMVTNAKIGAHLSGGLDSSGIAGLAHQLAKKNDQSLYLFSYNLPDEFDGNPDLFDENLRAFDLVDYVKAENFINVNEVYFRDFKRMIQDEVLFMDGFSQSNNVNTEQDLQERAHREGVNVILSGFPGDELVTSFCRPYYLEYFEEGKYLKYFTKKMKSRHGMKEKIKAFAGATLASMSSYLSDKLVDYYTSTRFDKSNYAMKLKILNDTYFSQYPELYKPEFFPRAHHKFPTGFREYQRNHICREHTTQRITGERLSGLRWKVDYRYPMLDIRVLEYLISIPMEEKISPDMNRRIFRLGMKDIIPESIRLRDQKHKGSLKPMVQFVKSPKDQSFLEQWQRIKDHDAAPFLDNTMIDNFLKTKKRAFAINKWMMIAEMGAQGKASF